MKRLAALMLAVAATCLGVALASVFAWYHAARGPVSLDRLSHEQRQKLAEEMVAVSAGVFEPAWFEPAIGYTLRRGAEITAWNDTFKSNKIGFRTGPVAKPPGTFRVLFVGDSWTFGMGVKEAESFPKVFEQLARQYSGESRSVEAWQLALPGWNTLAEVSALWFFFDHLRPDLVVICPTSNDNHSLAKVLPNGSLASVGVVRDEFGDPHETAYPVRHLDSYRARQRWRTAFGALADTEHRLAALQVPMLTYFVARWRPAFMHALVAESGLTTPYFATPLNLTLGPWLNPPPVEHGTPAANQQYGAMVYDAVAEVLGWPQLPESVERPRVPLFRSPPPAEQWQPAAEALLADETRREIPQHFVPSATSRAQCLGAIDPGSGLLGRAATVLVRRPEGAAKLAIKVRKLAEAPALYPLSLVVTIPSPSGGSRLVFQVPEGGDERDSFEVAIPADLRPGSALDVVLEASRTTQAPDVLAARSLYVEAIEPRP